MSRQTYDLSLLAGLGCLTAGVHLLAGLPWALIVAGSAVIALTLIGAALGSQKAG